VSEIRVLPLPKVTGVWKHDTSKYPDVIRVPMSDGRVVKYVIDIEQPHPCLTAALRNVRNMVGYVYGKTGDSCNCPPAGENKHPWALYHRKRGKVNNEGTV
jgi:hypothetical protein